MLKFRKKILFSDFFLFLIFVTSLFPLVERTVNGVLRRSLENEALKLITLIKKGQNVSEMLQILEEHSHLIYQPVTLISPKDREFYDLQKATFVKFPLDPDYEAEHPEIHEALFYGKGYGKSYSTYRKGMVSYVALSFLVNKEQYVLRFGYSLSSIESIIFDFKATFLILGTLVLFIFSITKWWISHRISLPIQQIFDAILPYKEGQQEHLPKIILPATIQTDEFGKLASTLNSLNEKIQKQIENLTKQRKETEEILESLGEGVIAFDTTAKVTFANQVSCKILCMAHEAMMGQTLDEAKIQTLDIELLAKKCHEIVLQALQTSETICQIWVLGEGNKTYLNLISSPLAHQSGAILVLQDKTSDHKVVEMGKDFIANASHELRTPITIIRGFAETLQDIPNLNKKLLDEITEKIVRTCGRLDKLVKSLLTLSDIENLSEGRFHPCDLNAVSEHCKHILESVHPHVHLELENSLDRPLIVADADLIDLAILNLLENAVKYSYEPPKISIRIKEGEHETVKLSIKDEGIGIPMKDLPRIFDRFYTVDKARSRKSGGAGLGLSIVKTIVEKHKGSIAVDSEMGRGTCFTMTFPLYQKSSKMALS